jgi:hypothetical protein
MRLTGCTEYGRLSGMDDLQLIKSRLAAIPISELRALGESSGIPFGTLFKIKYGTTKNPRFDTVKPLADYFRAQEHRAASA